MRFTNPTPDPVAVRDDAGKHLVEPGGVVDLTGAQHAPVWAAAGLVEAAEAAVPTPMKGGKEPADDPVADATGEAGGRPDQAAPERPVR